ncbi:hypothetical protein EDC94DRAFT_589271 [Helicostylum pulchrum]|nr:hypothetical protein EDC94DRAFT_589271 [Helicostylum pulchrum]
MPRRIEVPVTAYQAAANSCIAKREMWYRLSELRTNWGYKRKCKLILPHLTWIKRISVKEERRSRGESVKRLKVNPPSVDFTSRGPPDNPQPDPAVDLYCIFK